jgi:hypothetical protein
VEQCVWLSNLLDTKSGTWIFCSSSHTKSPRTGYGDFVYPDDTGKDLATVLSYLAGRSLSREEIWTAMELPRSTYYDQLDKGTLITADNLHTVAANLGINRAELLTRYRFIDPEEVTSLAEEIHGRRYSTPTATNTDVKTPRRRTTIADLRPRPDAPPL